MTAHELSPNRHELALLRGKRAPEHLAAWVEAFAEGDEELAKRYAVAIATFLGDSAPIAGQEWSSYIGKLSPHTRAAYSFAVTEFFEWASRKYGRVVPPHRVLRKDAEDYANWLANRPWSLTEEKLHDTDQELRRAVYDAVERVGPADRSSIYAALHPAVRQIMDLDQLTFTLGRMVLHDFLVRSPTLSQIREQHPRAGIDQLAIPIPLPDGNWTSMNLADVFQYAVPPPRGVSRSTIALRLSALSTFWDVLAQGENIPGGQAILQHNVFKGLKKRVNRGISRERKASSAARRMDPSLVSRLLAYANGASTLPEKRDKALLYFLVFTGARLSEAINLRRGEPMPSEVTRWPGWFVGNTEPPVVRVRRKGGKMQSLPYPPVALRALADFQYDLDRRAAPSNAQSDDPSAPHYLHSNSPRWRYRELSRLPDAPLFPPVHFWGANSTYNYQEFKPNVRNTYGPPTYRRSMSRAGVYKLLVRMAENAGFTAEEIAQVHPHALRHFAATAMAKGGKDLREIQSILGHESVMTTEGYLEDVESIVALSGQAEILEYLSQFEGAQEAVPAPPPHAPKPVRREVIETYAVPVPAASGRPAPAAAGRPPVAAGKPRKKAPTVPQPPPPGVPPTPKQELAAIQAAAPAYVGPEAPAENALAVAPPADDDSDVQVHATPSGHVTTVGDEIVAIEGEPVPPEVKAKVMLDQIRDNKSPGSPDDVYEALNTGDHWELIEYTALTPRTSKDAKLVTISTSGWRKKNQDLVQRQTKTHRFLADHYDPWPLHYGIGTVSLLPWYSIAQAQKMGKKSGKPGILMAPDPVTGKMVEVPPLPVLSPAQIAPEAGANDAVLEGLEQLYGLWLSGDPAQGINPSPSRTFGLVRWFGFFAYSTGKLMSFLRRKQEEYKKLQSKSFNVPQPNMPKWGGYDEMLEVGKFLRTHKDSWVLDWFRVNSHTFITTRDAFLQELRRRHEGDRPGGSEFDIPFNVVVAESLSLPASLPDWFIDDDPVKAIYDRSPEEWERFAKWIANITGQKLAKARLAARGAEAELAEKSWEEKREEARELLIYYWEEIMTPLRFIGMLKRGRHVVLPERYADLAGEDATTLNRTRKALEATREDWVKRLNELGIPDPQTMGEVQEEDAQEGEEQKQSAAKDEELFVRDRQKRIQAILERYIPEPNVKEEQEETANVLRTSKLFDADLLNIDYKAHTITHTPEFRQQFAKQYDGRDSELVMRRAARAMWEYAKDHGQVDRPPDAKKGYQALYSVMLCYISWIVPSPERMEAESIAAGRVTVAGPEARRSYIAAQAEMMYAAARAYYSEDEQERRTALVRKLRTEGATEAEIDKALSEDEVQYWASQRQITLDEARVFVEQLHLTQVIAAESEARQEQQVAGVVALMGEGGPLSAAGEHAALEIARQEKRKAERKERKIVETIGTLREGEKMVKTGVFKRGSMKANPGSRITVEYMRNERVDTWHQLTYDVTMPEHMRSREYSPNRGVQRFVSPSAMAHKQRLLANAMRVMPSPLRLLAAMNLEAVEA